MKKIIRLYKSFSGIAKAGFGVASVAAVVFTACLVVLFYSLLNIYPIVGQTELSQSEAKQKIDTYDRRVKNSLTGIKVSGLVLLIGGAVGIYGLDNDKKNSKSNLDSRQN